jgi:nitrite reductase/ring-hydroxylating ferredoxin subunit
MDERIRVGKREDFPDGRGRAVDVAGERVAVFRSGDRWYALQDACPHMGASLADGALEGGRVVCDWHGRRFDLATGESDMRSGACARLFRIDVEGSDVYVEPRGSDRGGGPSSPDDDWEPFDPERHLKRGP